MALVAAYSFDTDYTDASGGGNTITSTGNSAIVSGGQTSNALGKTGSTMPVLPGAVLTACQSDDRTLMFDAKQNLTTWWVRFEKDAIGSGTWGILNISGSMTFFARRASDDAQMGSRPTATSPDSSGWHNYCVTYVRSTGVATFYRDGSSVGTASFAAGTQLVINADRINIAEWSGTGAAIDNLRFYSHALNSTEVAATAGTAVSGSITGTGSATAPTAQASGAGTVTVAGTGSATAPPAQAAGSGTLLVSGTGAATAPTAVAAGTGGVLVTGTGAATASPATASGAGTVVVAGAGAATAAPSVASGAGAVTVAGSGALTAPSAVAAGAGTLAGSVDGSGNLVAPGAIITGTGAIVITGVGQLTAPAAVVHGFDQLPRVALDPRATLQPDLAGASLAPNLATATIIDNAGRAAL